MTGSRTATLRRMQALLAMGVNPAPGFGPAATRRQLGLVQGAVAALEGGAGVGFVEARLDPDGTLEISPDQRGFLVTFASRATIDEILSGKDAAMRGAILATGCGALQVEETNGTPLGAIILVDADRPSGDQSYCVHREIVANMGLGGFLRRTDSIFSNSTNVATFSARDLVLIRMLYDPRLRNGMSAAQARPLLVAIAADALAR